MELFKCSVCNYTYEGETAPSVCPKCGADHSAFAKLDAAAKEKLYLADRTNSLLSELVALNEKMIAIAKEGTEINLDPGCFTVFTKANQNAWETKQFAKAEIETHVKRNKW